MLLRDSRSTSKKVGKGADSKIKLKNNLAGRSLLGFVQLEDKKIKREHPKGLSDVIDKYVAKVVAKRIEEGATQEEIKELKAKYTNSIGSRYVERKESRRMTFTLEELRAIFATDSDGVSNVNKGFGLRVPIQAAEFSDRPLSTLQTDLSDTPVVEKNISDYLSHNYTGVSHSNMIIEFESPTAAEEVKTATTPDTSDDIDTEIDRLDNDTDLDDWEMGQDIDPGEALDMASTKELYLQFNPTNWLNVLKKWFVGKLGKTQEERDLFRVLSEAAMSFIAGTKVWGRYKNGLALYTESSLGGGYSKAIAHEQFHKVSRGILTKEQRERMYFIAAQEYPGFSSMTEQMKEEYLADLFAEYAEARRTSSKFTVREKLARFFNRLLRPLGLLSRNVTSMEQFFDRVYSGYYGSTTLVENDGAGYNMQNGLLKEYFTTANNFIIARKRLIKYVHRHLDRDAMYNYLNRNGAVKEGEESYVPYGEITPYTFDEAVLKAEERLEIDLKLREKQLSRVKEAITKSTPENRQHLEQMLDRITKEIGLLQIMTHQRAFKFLATSIYPVDSASIQFSSKEERDLRVARGIEAVEADNEEDALSIFDEIRSKEILNLATATTKQLKLALSNILARSNTKGEKKVLVPYDKAFAVTINLIHNMPIGLTAAQAMEYVDRAAEPFATDKSVMAVRNFLKEQFRKSAVALNPKAQFHNESIYFEDIEEGREKEINLRQYTLEEANKDTGVRVIVKRENELQPDFLKRIAKEDQNLSLAEANTQYDTWKAYDFVADVAVTIQSLEDVSFLIGTTGYTKKGVKFFRYGKGRSSSLNEVYESHIINAIADRYREIGDLGTLQGRYSALYGSKKISNEQKAEYRKALITAFLKDIGLPVYRFSKQLPSGEDLETLWNEMNHALKRLSEDYPKEAKREGTDIVEFLNDQGSFLNNIVGFLSSKDMFTAVTTYMSGEGKRLYNKKRSSFGGEVLRYFKYLGSKTSRELPEHLQSDFYQKHNIFFNTVSELLEYADHDSVKIKGSDSSATTFSKESPMKWLERNLEYAFLAGMSSFSDKYYWQPLFTTSDKPTSRAAKVKVLKGTRIRSALKSMVIQEMRRISTETHSHLKNWTPNASYILSNIPGYPKLETIESTGDPKADMKLIEARVNELQERMQAQSDILLDKMIDDKYFFTDQLKDKYEAVTGKVMKGDVLKMFRELNPSKAKGKLLKEMGYEEEQFSKLEGTEKEEATAELEEKLEGFYDGHKKQIKEVLSPFVNVFYSNWYINSHQLNQMVAGDLAHYKPNGESGDLIKRLSMVFAPGAKMKIGEDFMPAQFKVVILQEPVELVKEYEGAPKTDRPEEIEMADAQAYHLPSYARKVALGSGVGAKVGKILKPVYFGMDKDGIPRALKVSSVELTDELVKRFPGLRSLREQMENGGIDMATFPSALKVGKLTDEALTKLYDADGNPLNEGLSPTGIEPNSVLTLNSSNMRIQLNPSKKAIGKIAHPSQLAYSGIINNDTIPILNRINSNTARRMKVGSSKIDILYRLANGLPTGATWDKLKADVLSTLKTQQGAEMEYALASVEGISWQIPLLSEKIIRTLGSTFSKYTAGFKMTGGKLVLQSEYGAFSQEVLGEVTNERLKWRDKDGFTEVFVTEELASRLGLSVGDLVLPEAMKAIAFRIPTTGLHSAITLKIKGTYPTPKGSKDNIIIAPSQIVHVHGSDYDVDSLMFITRNRIQDAVSPNDYNYGDILNNALGTDYDIQFTENQILGYLPIQGNEFTPHMVGDLTLSEFVQEQQRRLESELSKAIIAKNKAKISANFRAIKVTLDILERLIENDLVNDYHDIITHNTSRKYIELPITMGALKDSLAQLGIEPSALDVVAEMRGLKVTDNYKKERQELLYPNVDPSDVKAHQKIHENTWSGASLTGAAANAVKILAYIMMSTLPTSWNSKGEITGREQVKIKSKLGFQWNGARRDTLFDREMTSKWNEETEEFELVENEIKTTQDKDGKEGIKKTYLIWESLDSLINAAIDNVKEEIIYLINLNNSTANPYFAGIGMGVPMNSMVRLMGQPFLKYLIDTKKGSSIKEEDIKRLKTRLVRSYIANDPELVDNEEAIKDFKKVTASSAEVYDDTLTRAAQNANVNNLSVFRLSQEDKLVQIQALNVYLKLHEIGESVFTGANASSIMRTIATTYAKAKQTTEDIYNTISNHGFATTNERLIKEFQDLSKEQTEKVMKLFKQGKRKEAHELLVSFDEDFTSEDLEIFLEEIEDSKDVAFLEEKVKAYTDILARKNLNVRAADDWPFINSSMLNVPSFKEGFLNSLKYITMVEKLFFRHGESMNNFSRSILKDYLGKREFGENNFYKQSEILKNDYMTYLNSGMEFEIPTNSGVSTFSMEVTDAPITQETADASKKGNPTTFEGFKSFTYRLVKDIKAIQDKLTENGEPGNNFLHYLISKYSYNDYEYKIMFTAHKNSDPASYEAFKKGFRDLNSKRVKDIEKDLKGGYYSGVDILTDESSPYSDIQLRLMKYILISRGITFGATTFAELLSDEMFQMYSSKLESTIDPMKEIELDTRSNPILDSIKPMFFLQYARNNSSELVSHKPTDKLVNSTKEGKLDGNVTIENRTIQYDLSLKGEQEEGIILLKGKDVGGLYAKLETVPTGDNKNITYYRYIGGRNYSKYYSNSTGNSGDVTFDLSKVIREDRRILSSTRLKGTTLQLKETDPSINVGDMIFLRSPMDVGLETMKEYQVVDNNGNGSYRVDYIRPIDPFTRNPKKLPKKSKVTTVHSSPTLNNTSKKSTENIDETHSVFLNKDHTNKLKNGDTVSMRLSEFIERYKAVLETSPYYSLIKEALERADSNIILAKDIFVIGKDGEVSAKGGMYTGNSEVFMALGKYSTNSLKILMQDLAHELMHRDTQDALLNPTKYSKEVQDTVEAIEELYDKLKDNEELLGTYGISNVKEFVAEVRTNKEFQEALEKLPVQEGNAWSKIKELLQRLMSIVFGIDASNAYQQAFVLIENLIEEAYTVGELGELTADLKEDYINTLNKEYGIYFDSKKVQKLDIDNLNLSPLTADISFADEKKTEKKDKDAAYKTFIKSLEEDNTQLIEDTHYSTTSHSRLERLTEYLTKHFTPFKGRFETVEEYYADKDFKGAGIGRDELLTFPGNTKTYTWEERLEHHKVKGRRFKDYGTLAHAIMERALSKNSDRIAIITAKITELTTTDEYDDKGNLVRERIHPKELSWVNDNLKTIIKKSQINFDSSTSESSEFAKKYQDELLPELKIALPEFGIALTADGLIKRPNGNFGFVDWKTQNLLNDQSNLDFMKWGKSFGIRNNKLNKAKLQVTMAALAVKLKSPDAKFDLLSVNWLNKVSGVRVFHVNLAPYLGMIETWAKEEHPAHYQEMKKKGVFDANSYYATPVMGPTLEAEMPAGSPEQQMQYLQNRIDGISLALKEPDITNSKYLTNQRDLYTSKLLMLMNNSAADPNSTLIDTDSEDMDTVTSNLLNLKDARHPVVKAFNKVYFKSKFKAEQEKQEIWKGLDAHTKQILAEYYTRKGQHGAAAKVLKGKSLFRNLVKAVNSRDLYAFMWVEYNTDGKKGRYANLADTYIDINGKEASMTEAQKEYRDYYHKSMKKLYGEVEAQMLMDKDGKRVTKKRLFGMPDMYEDFMPRKQMDARDRREKYPGLSNRKERAKMWLNMGLDNYILSNFSEKNPLSIPLRYFHPVGSSIIENEEHTFDVEKSFKYFTSNLVTKKHLDSAYSLGKAFNSFLKGKSNAEGDQKYPVLTKWFEDQVAMHIVGNNSDGNFHYRETRVKVPKALQSLFNDREEITFDAWSFARVTKGAVSLAAMALKLIPATANGALIVITNHLKGATNSLAKHFYNLADDDLQFTLSDVIKADMEWGRYLKDWITGNQRNNKMWNISKNLQFLPDNYDYAVANHDMVGVKDTIFNKANLYYFHSMYENYGAHNLMTAMANKSFEWVNLENPKEKKVATMWEMYDEQGEFADDKWIRGYQKNQFGNLTPLRGFAEEEVNAMKKGSERLHGSYRQEEKVVMERHVLGQMAMQFKKYLPTLMKENLRRRNISQFTGSFKSMEVTELELDEKGMPIRPEGVPVYTWEEQMMEGRLRILANVTLNKFGWSNKIGPDKDFNYDWENLSPDQKASYLNAVVTAAIFILGMLAFLNADDDDKDKYAYVRGKRLLEDITLGINPMDMWRPLTQAPAVFTKVTEIWDSMGMLLTEGLLSGKTDSRGLPKGLYPVLRNIPVGSGIHQWNSVMDDYENSPKILENILTDTKR